MNHWLMSDRTSNVNDKDRSTPRTNNDNNNIINIETINRVQWGRRKGEPPRIYSARATAAAAATTAVQLTGRAKAPLSPAGVVGAVAGGVDTDAGVDAGDSEGLAEVGGPGGDAAGVFAEGAGDGGVETGEVAGGLTGAAAGGFTGAVAGGFDGAAAGGVKGAGAGGFTGAVAGGFDGAAAGPWAKETTASDIKASASKEKRMEATAISRSGKRRETDRDQGRSG
ncbi:unnamed protein product [Musa hybrid cultivar]